MTMRMLESSRQKGILEYLLDIQKKMASKQFSLEPNLSNLNETGKSSNPSVLQVFEAVKKDLEDLFQKFYDEYFDTLKIMKSSTTNVKSSNVEVPSHEEEVFHESSESFQKESSSSSLNDDVQQSSEEVGVPSSNTQSVSNNMVPNVDEASTSHNVFNKRLEDAYFDATLRDVDWVRAMQEELDQFARLKVWRLVPRPEGKTIIKTKWILKNKKDESSLDEVYVGQPPGFVSKQYPDHVYAFDKALYGLKQAPQAWSDIMFATCMCARYQANLDDHHVSAVKRIFCYFKGTINLGLWYPKDSGFDLTVYSDVDHAGCHLDRKTTSGSVQFLGDKLVCWSSKKQNYASISTVESEYVAVSS
uniref:Reverse transcriptase Ty1/copia-type domain-containing protein n=1 Tax=Tanacetum cinerariifolium TaxID=118510 RepID=A0A699JJB8_TANCI|nr:hypothetical protein [Tanacetum cinerariifolium]